MAIRAQLHVKLSTKDAASLRKLARSQEVTLSEVVRRLIRRAAIPTQRATGDAR